jgi:hypothetical protein
MKTITRRASLAAVLAIALTPVGCALLTPDATEAAKAADVQRLAYAASAVGTAAALDAKPEYRPAFVLALASLDKLVEARTISGVQLRDILLTLPIKELGSRTALIAIDAGATLFDVITGKPIDLEQTPYALAAATGIRDGLRTGLGSGK